MNSISIGDRFTRLLVISFDGFDKYGKRKWECMCDCGKTKVVRQSDLIAEKTKSCGCLCSEKARERATKHGLSNDPLYSVWVDMKKKCLCKTNKDYKYYGGRGITVCTEWLGFEAFYEWAISHGYDHSLPRAERTIDRIDTDKGYSPDNCRFVSMVVQNRNKHYKNIPYSPYLLEGV